MNPSPTRWLVSSLCVLSLAAAAARAEEPAAKQTAKGVVFVDANDNRKYDDGEQSLAGIKVSNGRTIVETDDAGRYEIAVDDDDILFVIKPRGYRTPLSPEKLPRFYYIHKPNGSPPSHYPGVEPTGPLPESIDFPLYAQKEPEQFKALLFGDPQPRNQKEVDWVGHDVVEELIGSDASFGVTLGDIAFNNLKTFEALNKTIALVGIPWYNVIGNHDINFDAKHDHHSDETFERVYGPPYYSFDYGQVHFIVLDDIEWYFPKPGGKGEYRGGLGEDQIEFIKNDLAMIPAEQMVVLMMHIPLEGIHDRQGLYRLIEKRPFCISISGHTHHHEHRYITKEDGWMGPEPHHHIINVTVCGSWWSGTPDERGIPHTTMADGAPNGYSIISFDGTDYTLDFKAAGRPADYQMEIHAPEEVAADQAGETMVYVNVFNGSERSKVEMSFEGGDWVAMQHTREIDPKFQEVYDAEAAVLEKAPNFRQLAKPKASSHLWKAKLPAELPVGVGLLRVRATDANGKQYTSARVIRVREAPAAVTAN
ncbi:MAG: metallophosphoesterase [Planctomycetota bacterium]|nr:MAG: metallophosphoesterase [Planctomycetota bacterium]